VVGKVLPILLQLKYGIINRLNSHNLKVMSNVKEVAVKKVATKEVTTKAKRVRKPKVTFVQSKSIKDIAPLESITFEGQTIIQTKVQKGIKFVDTLKQGITTENVKDTSKAVATRQRNVLKSFSQVLKVFIADQKEHKEISTLYKKFSLTHFTDARHKTETFKKLHSFLTPSQMIRYKEKNGFIFTPTMFVGLVKKYYHNLG